MNFALENLSIKEVSQTIRFSFEIKVDEKTIGCCNISLKNSSKEVNFIDGEQNNFLFQPKEEGQHQVHHNSDVVQHTDVSAILEQLALPKSKVNTEEKIAAFNISQTNDDDIADRTPELSDEETDPPAETVTSSFYVSVVDESEVNSEQQSPVISTQPKGHDKNSSKKPPQKRSYELMSTECDTGNGSYPYQNIQLESPKKRFQCEECGKLFKMKFDMKKHVSTVHLKIKPYPCVDCDKAFAHKGDLTRHVNDVHNKMKSFHCGECGKSFARKSHLARHLNDHLGIRHFQCNDCGKLAATKAELKNHQIIHSGVKDFKCEKCDKSFALASYLKQHVKISHSETRDFKCSQCDKSYTSKPSLTKHQKRVHKPNSTNSSEKTVM